MTNDFLLIHQKFVSDEFVTNYLPSVRLSSSVHVRAIFQIKVGLFVTLEQYVPLLLPVLQSSAFTARCSQRR